MKGAADEHDLVGEAGFSGSQNGRANARAFNPGNGVFHDDSSACQAFVEWPVSRLFTIGPPFGRSHRGMRLGVACEPTISEDSRAVRKPPFFKIDAVFVVPSAGSGFAQKNDAPVPDSEDVLYGVALFAPAVTRLASHAVFWPAARAVCAIDDERQGRKF